MKTTGTSAEIIVHPIATETLQFAVLGMTPLILNRLAEKARRELLLPTGRKTAAERAGALKHDPLAEFRAAPYTITDPDSPTLLAHMASAFKGALCTAALDMPGAKKTQIGRLVYVEGQHVPIYGVPEIFSTVVRSADINRTPDVRTRAIVPEWAAVVTVTYAVPLLNGRSITNLLAAAGTICGIGDWRPEKGKGNYGQFTLVDPEEARYARILETGGRVAQTAAMDAPRSHDAETDELLGWFATEADRRGKQIRAVA